MTDFEDRVTRLSDSRRALLERLRTERATPTSISPRPPDLARIPLSVQQEQLWFLDQMAPARATYNIVNASRLAGTLDVAALGRALELVVARHEALRTTFVAAGGVPHQVVGPAAAVPLPVDDLSGLPAERQETAAAELVEREARRPFDLQRGPLFRVRLIRLGPDQGGQDRHVLVLAVHHIVSDGWSFSVLFGEIVELYGAFAAGREPAPADLPVQYGDFAVWQRGWLGSARAEAQLGYWAQRLAGLPTLELPTDRPRPAEPSYRGGLLVRPLPPELADAVGEVAGSQGVSSFAVLLAAFGVLLARYTGQEDVGVGSTVAGRVRPELEHLVGFFVNMVVLRVDLSGDPSFAELVRRVREATLDAYEHQEVPFPAVVERVQPRREPSRNPLFQVAFGLLPAQTGGQTAGLPGLRTEQLPANLGTSRFDIAVNVLEVDGQLSLSVEYASDLFDRPRMERMFDHYERVLRAMTDDPSLTVSRVELLSGVERGRVLVGWQGVVGEFRSDAVPVRVGEQVVARAGAVAVVCGGRSLSYGQLWGRAGGVAGFLASVGVGRGDLVGVALGRGVDVPVCLLGVLRAGAAFVPVDPSHPAERIGFVLADSGVRVVLTSAADVGRLPAGDYAVVPVEGLPVQPDFVDVPVADDDPVYVLYTSGSTGRPKGVVIEHRALATYLDFLGPVFGFGPGDRLLQFSSLVFDLAEGEIFAGLSCGATVVMVPEETVLSPVALAALMRSERVSYVGAPPAMLALVEPEPYPDLRGLLVGGEAFSGDLVNRWNLPGRTFLNAYGPTEATIGCTFYRCEHKRWESSPPIGRAMPHRRVYLVDRWGNPVPVGVPGEIWAAGEGLARGYLDRPELTGQKFVADPFTPGGRAYRTGDLGVWTEDGQIQFLGRIDTQVKLHGQRIELEEIETVLAAHPGVAQAVAAVREDIPGDRRLVGYLLPADPAAPPPAGSLREHLARTLPGYMIPGVFLTLDSLPLTPTGKVDGPYTPPATGTEHLIAAAFADVLGLPQISSTDSFFDLGGTSLQAARVVARIADATQVALGVRRFYAAQTVAAVAAELEAARLAGAAEWPAGSPADPVVPLAPDGSRPPLFCVHAVSGSGYAYQRLAAKLAPGQPVYAFEAPGLDDDTEPVDRVEELAARYVEALRRRQPTGPYRLAGWSMGGLIAFQMAVELTAAGEQIALLALIDAPVPGRWDTPAEVGVGAFVTDLAGMVGRNPPPIDELPGDELAAADRLAGLHRVLTERGLLPADLGIDFLRRRLAVFQANTRAAHRYVPDRPFDGTITVLRAEKSPDSRDGWGRLAAALDDVVLDGDHYTIWSEPRLDHMVAALRDRLDRTAD